MAALKDIKRKISAVKKTKQITKAMNMVAASKFKSAQQRMENFRPYATKFMDVLSSLALRVDARNHPLLAVREPKRIRVICMTADRGLCGAFNTNVLKTTERFVKGKTGEGREVVIVPVGRKGRDYFRKKAKIAHERTDVFGRFDISLAVNIAKDIIPAFEKEEYDELYLIYNNFVNVSSRSRLWCGSSRCLPSAATRRSIPRKGSSTSTSLRMRPSLRSCFRCTSTSSCSGRSWKPRPEKTEHGWRPWTMRRATART